VVAEGLPGPALARHMLAVDPPDHTRPRRLACRRSVGGGSRLEDRVRSIVTALLDELEACGTTDRAVDLGRLRFRCPSR
jgi:cytochrome P450